MRGQVIYITIAQTKFRATKGTSLVRQENDIYRWLFWFYMRNSVCTIQLILWQSKQKYEIVEITNKMQHCNRIYYSTVHWRLNMFRAAYRSSSGALTVFAASGLHRHVVTDRSQVWVGTGQFPFRLDYGRLPHAYVNQRLQIQLELLMMSGMPLETCSAFNKFWNNKFYYKVASCWLFLLIHTTMHGSMNIKKNRWCTRRNKKHIQMF